jgi:hypothetical protein
MRDEADIDLIDKVLILMNQSGYALSITISSFDINRPSTAEVYLRVDYKQGKLGEKSQGARYNRLHRYDNFLVSTLCVGISRCIASVSKPL